MEINQLPRSEIKKLLKSQEEYFSNAIQNKVEFEKTKEVHKNILMLRALLSKKKLKNK